MTIYIALLRGINVSGQKKIKMEALRSMMCKLGFEAVTTYIQSGNIVFKANSPDSEFLQQSIERHIEITFGHEVPVLVLSIKELTRILDLNPYREPDTVDLAKLYYVLLFHKPAQERIVAFNSEKFDNERFAIANNCVYLSCEKGYGNAKLNNNLVERKLKVTATTRNHKTMIKLIEMANEVP
ncbi:MAG: DUF1697 domain-containing protein [Flavobacteriaceae bacterium]